MRWCGWRRNLVPSAGIIRTDAPIRHAEFSADEWCARAVVHDARREGIQCGAIDERGERVDSIRRCLDVDRLLVGDEADAVAIGRRAADARVAEVCGRNLQIRKGNWSGGGVLKNTCI